MKTLVGYLKQRSSEINCESYAYINADYQLLDICSPDYFCGSSRPYAAIPLPWAGSQAELQTAVDNDIEEAI